VTETADSRSRVERYDPSAIEPRWQGEWAAQRLYETDLDDVRRRVTARTKAVILCSPHNPAGTIIPRAPLRRFLDALGDDSPLVVLDEAYCDFVDDPEYPDGVELLAQYPRLLVLRTFSKALGMAGLRFGLALAHPAVARELAKGKLPYNVNLVTLAAAGAVLRHADALAERAREIVETRQRFMARVRGLRGLTLFPSAANFVLIRCEGAPARDVFRRLLDEDGILVRDVSSSPDLADCLRISIGTPDDMDAAAAALERILG